MGIVTMGPPKDIVLKLSGSINSSTFVETGTFKGNTAIWAKEHFQKVYSIELSKFIYDKYCNELKDKGINAIYGDSRSVLPTIIEEVQNERCVFWLDGHWSGGDTYGANDECPLIDELNCLTDRNRDIIMIDDARLFLSAPPLPHKPRNWPTVTEIINLLQSSSGRYIQIIDDVIFAIPNENSCKEFLIEYAQDRANWYWEIFSKNKNNKLNQLKKIVKKVTS